MSDKKIVSISFIRDGERVTVMATPTGSFKFLVPSRSKMRYKFFTARQVIEHETIRDSDPVLTLANGDKIRVYVGGDSSYLPAMSQGIVEKHDRSGYKEGKKSKKVIVPTYQSSKDTEDMNDTDEYDFEFPWDDTYGI